MVISRNQLRTTSLKKCIHFMTLKRASSIDARIRNSPRDICVRLRPYYNLRLRDYCKENHIAISKVVSKLVIDFIDDLEKEK